MNLFKKLGRGIVLIAISMIMILPLSNDAFADNTPNESALVDIFSMDISASGPNAEVAHKAFKQIYGGFIFAPWGGSDYDNSDISLIAHAVGFTNVLAFLLGVVIIYYVMIGGALNTTQSGEALGKWSTIWLPLRTAAGFFLIMPIPGVGAGVLSVAQMLILWLVIVGSNAGTVLYSSMVDKVLAGTSVNSTFMPLGLTPTKDMAKMLACTEINIRKQTSGKGGGSPERYKTIATITGESSSVVLKSSLYNAEMDAYRLSSVGFASALANTKANKISFGEMGRCGTINLGIYRDSTEEIVDASGDYIFEKSYKGDVAERARDASNAQIGKTLDALIPVVQILTGPDVGALTITDSKTNNESNGDSSALSIYDQSVAQFTAIATNFSVNAPRVVHETIIESDEITSKWKNEVAIGGWMRAGTWFHEIASFSNISQMAIQALADSFNPKNPTYCGSISLFNKENCELFDDQMQRSMQMFDMMLGDAAAGIQASSGSNSMSPADFASFSCSSPEECSGAGEVMDTTSVSLSKSVLNSLGGGGTTGTSGSTNPFQVVTEIGNTLTQISLALWAAGGVIASIFEALSSFQGGAIGMAADLVTGSASSWALGIAIGLLKWLALSLISAVLIMITMGFVLAFLIPFLPVVTWIMMISGYLLSVVEATIAAPLAIIMMVTPEGEGIVGTRLERAIQLLAMAILKPTLMVVGLIASIGLSSVCFALMNSLFFISANNYLQSNLYNILAILVIYTTIALQLCKLMISIMHKLPEQILEWFAGGASRPFGENDVGGTIEQGASGIKSGLGSMSGTLSNSVKNSVSQRNLNKRGGMFGKAK